MIKLLLLGFIALFVAETVNSQANQGTLLSLPKPDLCARRRISFIWTINGKRKGYYVAPRDTKLNWLEARNACRDMCMDSIGIETKQENDLVLKWMNETQYQYIWTSGRLCDFTGCAERQDLKPLNVNGWFWSDSNTKTAPTNKSPPNWGYQPWSQTGHTNASQPDNAEFDINETPESCLGILNNIYNDGIKWHDIACYHKKPYICEDSELLLRFVGQNNPHLNLEPNDSPQFLCPGVYDPECPKELKDPRDPTICNCQPPQDDRDDNKGRGPFDKNMGFRNDNRNNNRNNNRNDNRNDRNNRNRG